MQIILYGPPAVGKSTVGAILAEQLEVPFYDTDRLVGEDYRVVHREIGEEAFRQKEKEVIAYLEGKEGVIALGGGCLEPPFGHVIYLTASLGTLWERVCARPEFPTYLPEKDPKTVFFARVESRLEHYEQMADTIVDTDGKRPSEVVDLLIEEVLSSIS